MAFDVFTFRPEPLFTSDADARVGSSQMDGSLLIVFVPLANLFQALIIRSLEF